MPCPSSVSINLEEGNETFLLKHENEKFIIDYLDFGIEETSDLS